MVFSVTIMKKALTIFVVLCIAAVAVLVYLFSRNNGAAESTEYVYDDGQYEVVIEEIYSADGSEISQQDIDDAILEMIEDAKYNSEFNN